MNKQQLHKMSSISFIITEIKIKATMIPNMPRRIFKTEIERLSKLHVAEDVDQMELY